MLRALLHTARELVYRDRCGVCGRQDNVDNFICRGCNPNCSLLAHAQLLAHAYCKSCGESAFGSSTAVCQSCQLYPLPTKNIRSIWTYTDAAEDLIRAYKYHRATALVYFLEEQILKAIQSGAFPPDARYNWNLIVPTPSTNQSLANRGFSPVGEIVKKLSFDLSIPTALLAVQTIGKHPPQVSLPPSERLKHLKRKFQANRARVIGKRVLLVDDVVTSGATLIGVTLALLKAGAERVDVVSICRSELFSQLRSSLYKEYYRHLSQ